MRVLNVVFFLRDAKRGRFSYSWLSLNVFIRFFGLLDWTLQTLAKKGKFRIVRNGNSVSVIVPPEYADLYLFLFSYKKIVPWNKSGLRAEQTFGPSGTKVELMLE